MSSVLKSITPKRSRSPSAGAKTTAKKQNKAKPASASQPSTLNAKAAKPFGNVSVRSPNTSKKVSAAAKHLQKSLSPKSEKKKTAQPFAIESILEPIVPKLPRQARTYFIKKYQENATISSRQDVCDNFSNANQAWNKLTDKQKQPYIKLAEKDLQRYQQERKQYEETGFFINSDGVSSSDLVMLKHATFKPNVTMPKKVKTGYMFFIKKQFEAKKLSLNTEGLRGIKLGNLIVSALSKDWNLLTDKKKAAYNKFVEADQIRYDREMNQLLTQGFFIREDGTKTQNNRRVGVKRQIEHAPAEEPTKRLKK